MNEYVYLNIETSNFSIMSQSEMDFLYTLHKVMDGNFLLKLPGFIYLGEL